MDSPQCLRLEDAANFAIPSEHCVVDHESLICIVWNRQRSNEYPSIREDAYHRFAS